MRFGKRKLTLFLIMCAIITASIPTNVYAADLVTVELILAGQNQTNITVDVMDKGADALTNGKFRIKYNPDQLKLISHKDGNLGEKAMFIRNDCMNGNKEEGEIVVAFASSEGFGEDGSLGRMEFAIQEQVKEKEEIMLTVHVEELSTLDEDVESKSIPLTLVMQNGGTVAVPESGYEQEKKETSGKGTDDSKITPKGKDKTNPSKTASNAKTGDNTNILFPILGVVIAAVVILVLVLIKKKKTK